MIRSTPAFARARRRARRFNVGRHVFRWTAGPSRRALGPATQGAAGGPVKSPEIAADERVTFRLRAPNAKEVAVSIGGKRLPMQKDEQGVWSVTSDPMAPDFYTYSLVIDGATINDPSNRQVQTSFGSFQSMFIVPGPQPGCRRRACRAARSRAMRSIPPSPTTTATSSSTRRPATTRGARSPIPCCTCCMDWATMRSGG